MKKLVLALVLAGAVSSAYALDLGIVGTTDVVNGQGATRNGFGINVTQHFTHGLSLTGEYDRQTKTGLNKWDLIGGYDVTKIGAATLTAKAGLAYVDPAQGQTGYAGLVGAGVTLPVTQNVSATADYRYQYGQDRVKFDNGNSVLVGLKYTF